MGVLPDLSCLILSSLISMHITSFPVSAKQVPVTNPTYPVPIIANFIGIVKNLRKCSHYFIPIRIMRHFKIYLRDLNQREYCVSYSQIIYMHKKRSSAAIAFVLTVAFLSSCNRDKGKD